MTRVPLEQILSQARQLQLAGLTDDAIALYRVILRASPQAIVAMNGLAELLRARGDLNEGIELLERAVSIEPNSAALHNNLGIAYRAAGRHDDAIKSYRRAAELMPSNSAPLNNIGVLLQEIGRVDEAIEIFRRGLSLSPESADLHNSIAHTLQAVGRLDEALDEYQRAISLNPDFPEARSNFLYMMHFHERFDAPTIYQEHRRWNEEIAAPLRASIHPHKNDRSPDRRLRIGYASPDFRFHVVGRFMLPLLASHDRERFEIFCYSNDHRLPDAMTEQLKGHSDNWRVIAGQGDDPAAQQIRADGIDILVDLTMHMSHNRMQLFARKPAPVQMTYLAYCSTTGLDTIDYRITDPYLDPPKDFAAIYSERSLHLPETYWCYQPPFETAPIAALPAGTSGAVTFGSLNNFVKVRPITIATWCRILREVPDSRLLLHAQAGEHRARVREILAAQHVDPARLEFISQVSLSEFYALHNRIDIALDPFPYGGGTTSCDALWMGVPVVTLRGQTAVGRGGASILSNLGYPDLIAENTDEYARIAINLATDRARLTDIRGSLRSRMERSPLTDAPRFARNVETLFRNAWKTWCEK